MVSLCDGHLRDWKVPQVVLLVRASRGVADGQVKMTNRKENMRQEGKPSKKTEDIYLAEKSIGYQLRSANREMQRELEEQIRPYGITTGMWYFLRVLWEEDGLSQRELSDRAGTAEPTTVTALHAMENRGLVVRVQNKDDRRKSNIYLTKPARDLKDVLLPVAQNVNNVATKAIPADEIEALRRTLQKLRLNLSAQVERRNNAALGQPTEEYRRASSKSAKRTS
jgi:MarR family transcriptional regulator, organic hydroperoxide resistance regulator